MEFNQLQISTIAQLRQYLPYIRTNTCDYTVGGIFMWRKYFKMEYAIENQVFYWRLSDPQGHIYYNLPLAQDMEGALVRLIDHLKAAGEPARFCTVPEACLPMFQKHFAIQSIREQTDYFDYLYATEDLVSLTGKKYKNQRNLIRQFEKSADSWSVRPITRQDIPAIRQFYLQTCASQSDDPIAQEEQEMTLEVLDHFADYDMLGGVLLVADAICGFSLGEIRNDTFFVHIEKADRRLKGAYQMLNREMALLFAHGKVSFINREEDMGDLGLRKAKEAYHPLQMLKKFTVEVEI